MEQFTEQALETMELLETCPECGHARIDHYGRTSSGHRQLSWKSGWTVLDAGGDVATLGCYSYSEVAGNVCPCNKYFD